MVKHRYTFYWILWGLGEISGLGQWLLLRWGLPVPEHGLLLIFLLLPFSRRIIPVDAFVFSYLTADESVLAEEAKRTFVRLISTAIRILNSVSFFALSTVAPCDLTHNA